MTGKLTFTDLDRKTLDEIRAAGSAIMMGKEAITANSGHVVTEFRLARLRQLGKIEEAGDGLLEGCTQTVRAYP
jgi:hypothetical protein